MQLKRLLDDDDAVSPVIGVILMVAITVILAAVIATFVLGLGEQIGDTGPTASFSFDYDGGSGDLTITHSNGNTIEPSELFVRWDSDNVLWESRDSSMVSAGSSITVDVDSGDTVRVVWEGAGSGQSKTLEEWRA